MTAKCPRLVEVVRRRTRNGRRLLRIDIERPDSVADSVLRAAERTGVPLQSHPRRLADAVDGDALDDLFSEAPASFGNRSPSPPDDSTRMVVFDLWDRTFVVTDAAVEVYGRRRE